MPPALLLLRVGRIRWLVLPLPLFLLWPLYFLTWGALYAMRLLFVHPGRSRTLVVGSTALHLITALPGTSIDFQGSRGAFFLKFI